METTLFVLVSTNNVMLQCDAVQYVHKGHTQDHLH